MMQDISASERRQAFTAWLRTGRRPTVRDDGVELKFNPYHDPRNGRFTFAPGGPQSLSRVVITRRRVPYVRVEAAAGMLPAVEAGTDGSQAVEDRREGESPAPGVGQVEAVRRGAARAAQTVASAIEAVREKVAGVANDLTSLEAAVPSLKEAAAGASLIVPPSLFDSAEVTAQEATRFAVDIVNGLRTYAPGLVDKLDPVALISNPIERLRNARLWRAAAAARFRNDFSPMQIETLRLMQDLADEAYAEVTSLIAKGAWKVRISPEMTIGNYIDAKVRKELRVRYAELDIDERRSSMIRVNRRELETTMDETTFTRPDARVANVAFDVTIADKTLKTPQVQRFFRSDFQPTLVAIVRPRQLGSGHTHILTRPETKNGR